MMMIKVEREHTTNLLKISQKIILQFIQIMKMRDNKAKIKKIKKIKKAKHDDQ